jgi:hypothetical protein
VISRIFSIRIKLDQAALITLIFYELYFLCTFANWVTYFLTDNYFKNESLSAEEENNVNNYFYVGDFTATFMILLSQSFFTFEMNMIKVCLQSQSV